MKKWLFFDFAITFVLLVGAVLFGFMLEIPLAVSLLLFLGYGWKQGYSWRSLFQMMGRGIGESMVVVSVMLMIGMLTASWFLSGTIPYLVRLGIQVIRPDIFVLCAFLICAGMSITIGTSFGTANTLGVVLMVIAKGSGVNPALTAGAIISGIFVGDRCSPMSSSLVLVSTVTGTKLYDNVKMCFRTMVLPLGITCIAYLLFSIRNPLGGSSETMVQSIEESFSLNLWLVVPILIIFVLCLLKIPIKITMTCSILAAVALAFQIQKLSVEKVLFSLLLGYRMEPGAEAAQILHGGGLVSMLSTCAVVLLSCMITKVLEETGAIRGLTSRQGERRSFPCYMKTLCTGFVTAAIGCNQTVGIIMTTSLRKSAYEYLGKERLAEDITVAGSMVPALIPWCIAVYTPVHSIGYSGLGYYPYLFLFFALVVCQGLKFLLRTGKGS